MSVTPLKKAAAGQTPAPFLAAMSEFAPPHVAQSADSLVG
jgi:hypothetical protein